MMNVLYEDNHLIIVNKKSGDIVQADKTGDTPLSSHVKTYIKQRYSKPGNVFLGTIHRLDRPTSGIVMYARTSKALSRMNKQFREKKVEKTYLGIVEEPPPQRKGRLKNFLKKNKKVNKSYITDKNQGKEAILDYIYLKKLNNYHLLEIRPTTGRHHQIRVQLSNIGCIIKGDIKYGAKRNNQDASIDLLAHKIKFKHPVTKDIMKIVANPPEDNVWDSCL